MADDTKGKDPQKSETTKSRHDTRTIKTLEYLRALCVQPLDEFYKFAVACDTEYIENMLKRVPSIGRDREIAQEALHGALEHLIHIHNHNKDQDTRDSAAKSAQSVLKMVVANIANTRDSVTYSQQMADAYARLQDLAKKHEEQEKLYRKLAFEDDLTGCYNQRFFLKQLPEEVAEARKYGSPLSMIKFDIDHFKQVNDKYGHPAADEFLKRLAGNVRATLLRRPSDIFVRYGGDEFIVLLPEHEESKAKGLAEAIRACAEETSTAYEGKPIRARVSVGVKQYNPADTREFWGLTDTCLYVAKRTGRNKVVAESDVRKVIRENTLGREMLQKKVLEFDDALYDYFAAVPCLPAPGSASLKVPDASSPGGTTA